MEKKTILIIDDDSLVSLTAQRLLTREGYEALTALGADAALELVARNKFDLIICDLRMPVTNGVQTLSKIREVLKAQGRKEIPVFFFTGFADDLAFQKAKAMGEVLLKPYDIHELLALVRKHLGADVPS